MCARLAAVQSLMCVHIFTGDKQRKRFSLRFRCVCMREKVLLRRSAVRWARPQLCVNTVNTVLLTSNTMKHVSHIQMLDDSTCYRQYFLCYLGISPSTGALADLWRLFAFRSHGKSWCYGLHRLTELTALKEMEPNKTCLAQMQMQL